MVTSFNYNKVFHSADEWKKYFFPKQYEKDRLEKMTPEELGKEHARQAMRNLLKQCQH